MTRAHASQRDNYSRTGGTRPLQRAPSAHVESHSGKATPRSFLFHISDYTEGRVSSQEVLNFCVSQAPKRKQAHSNKETHQPKSAIVRKFCPKAGLIIPSCWIILLGGHPMHCRMFSTPLLSTQQMPVAPSQLCQDCLQMLPNVPCGCVG